MNGAMIKIKIKNNSWNMSKNISVYSVLKRQRELWGNKKFRL
jgi:hypothetical protein